MARRGEQDAEAGSAKVRDRNSWAVEPANGEGLATENVPALSDKELNASRELRE